MLDIVAYFVTVIDTAILITSCCSAYLECKDSGVNTEHDGAVSVHFSLYGFMTTLNQKDTCRISLHV